MAARAAFTSLVINYVNNDASTYSGIVLFDYFNDDKYEYYTGDPVQDYLDAVKQAVEIGLDIQLHEATQMFPLHSNDEFVFDVNQMLVRKGYYVVDD